MHTWPLVGLYALLLHLDGLKVSAWKRPGESDRRRAPPPDGTHRRRLSPPAADPTTCVPNGLSVFYDNVYEVPEPNGALHGYDSSDVRYRQPVNSEHIPGGKPSLVYTHTSSANLWIGGTHITFHDVEYRRCIGIKAVVNLAAPVLYQEDKYPYWDPYPNFDPRTDAASTTGTFPQISLAANEWFEFYSQIETFIDGHLSNGETVWMYDANGDFTDEFVIEQEACGAACIVAATYIARKANLDASEAVDQLVSIRPDKTCFNETLQEADVLDKITALLPASRRLDRIYTEAGDVAREQTWEEQVLEKENQLLQAIFQDNPSAMHGSDL